MREEYVLQHRDKDILGSKWFDHQTALFRSELMPEMYHLAEHGSNKKEYRIVRRTETVLILFNGQREINP